MSCPVCGSSFVARPSGKPQIYCSVRCRRKNKAGKYRSPALMKRCALPGCHHLFAPNRAQTYCSLGCRRAGRLCTACAAPTPDLPGDNARLCRDCDAERARLLRDDPVYRARQVASHRARNFGITPADYVRMCVEQDHKCAICRQPETARSNGGGVKTLSVDHDHETGQVRMLLCTRCNTALGLFRDDPHLLAAAKDYLCRHASKAAP